MYLSFAPGLLGITADFFATLNLAARHGFVGVDSTANQLAALAPEEIEALAKKFAALRLRPGYFGLDPVVISAPDGEWQKGIVTLQKAAPMAQRLGYTRAIAVILPFSETRTFDENFAFHLARFAQVLPILAEHGVSLGIEYVAPLTRRAPYKHHFIHDLRGALELIAAANAPNLGLLLDSFHWFCAHETPAQIAALRAEQIVAVHLNDAIVNRPRDEQSGDGARTARRERRNRFKIFFESLGNPRVTDGPLTCEPMNESFE